MIADDIDILAKGDSHGGRLIYWTKWGYGHDSGEIWMKMPVARQAIEWPIFISRLTA